MDLSIINIYWPHLLVLPLASIIFSFVGLHLTARSETWKSFSFIYWVEFLKLFIFTLFIYIKVQANYYVILVLILIGGQVFQKLTPKKFPNEFYFLMMIVLQGFSLFLVRLFPGLENIWRSSLFGDPSLLQIPELVLLFLSCTIIAIFCKAKYRKILKISFLKGLNIPGHYFVKNIGFTHIFELTTMTLLTISVLFQGTLLTLTQFFLVPLFLLRGPDQTFKTRFYTSSIITSTGTLMGFFASLCFENFATTPSIIISQLIILGIYLILKRFRKSITINGFLP